MPGQPDRNAGVSPATSMFSRVFRPIKAGGTPALRVLRQPPRTLEAAVEVQAHNERFAR